MENFARLNCATAVAPAIDPATTLCSTGELPLSAWATIWRGVRGFCPRCNKGKLFRAYLKPVSHCSNCKQDWTLERADDFPAYISILLSGHILVPMLVVVNASFDLSTMAFEALMIPSAILSVVGFLQPAKGGVIGMQWWHGMHGFTRERPRSGVSASES